MAEENRASTSTTVNSVSLTLPPFWPEQPTIWFAQTEAQFVIRNISVELTKFYHVVAALDGTTAQAFRTYLIYRPENRLSTKFMSRHWKYKHHSDLDARHATVNLHKLACVTITPRLVQQPAIVMRHVRWCRLATRHAFRETPVPATACEHSRWESFETVSRSRLPVRRELFG